MKFSSFQTNLLLLIESRNNFKVKYYSSLYLTQISQSLIEIHSKVIDCLDKTSIFSEEDYSNGLNFQFSSKFKKLFSSKETN